MKENITKKEILAKLITVRNSSQVVGQDGLVIDLNEIIAEIEKDVS